MCGVSTLSRDPAEQFDLASGWEDDLASVAAGRDFMLLRTAQGKVNDAPERHLTYQKPSKLIASTNGLEF